MKARLDQARQIDKIDDKEYILKDTRKGMKEFVVV
jgi:hypothetical protein